MNESDPGIGRLHRLKSAIGHEIDAGNANGAIACPNCPHDGEWHAQTNDWLFSCEECGVRVEGRSSRVRSVN
jgi:predicted RNA-binding Zn-ribbon protein involved in translation (DUF1610 family)